MTETKDYIEKTELDSVLLIKRPVFSDSRGFFREVFRKQDLESILGSKLDFVQANHSRSSLGALRGIHLAPCYKLITVTSGKVQQVVVDLRPESSTFGKHVSVLLGGDDNKHAILVPPGCGNSFLVLSETADYFYMFTDYWAPGMEKDILYSDPDLNIAWQNNSPQISERDSKAKTVRELFPEKF